MVKPEDGEGSFNTSSFSVRIMSSDMQRALAGGTFSFSEDTQMVLSEQRDGLYAYVHYFSLYDIHARGYVRQFAISYLTPSLKKITDNFSDFLEKFSEVTRMLSCGNQKVFGKDVEHRLADLEYTRELISQEGWSGDNTESSTLYEGFDFGKENVPERDPAVVENGIIEMKAIMESLKKEMGREVLQRMQLYLESKRRSFQKLVRQYSPGPPLNNDAASFLAQTSQEPLQNGSPQSELSISSESSNYQPQRAMAHYVQRFERRLRDLKELSAKAYLIAMERLDFVYKHFSRSESALEMEKEEREFLYPHSSILTLGRIPVMNVFHNIMTSSRPHLHELRPYLLCSKEVEPHVRQAPQAMPTALLDYGALDQGGFDKTFADESNALNKCPLYLNPSQNLMHQLSISDSLATPLALIDTAETPLMMEPQLLPLIRGAQGDEGGGEGGEGWGEVGGGGGMAVAAVSSGEYHDTGSGNSAGFHTPQEFTPGNSPRTSTMVTETADREAELKPENGHTHFLTSSSPSQRTPVFADSTLSPDRTSSGAIGQPDKPVSNRFEDWETGQQIDVASIHNSLVISGVKEMVREMRDSATFSPSEETSSAGWGQLESSPRQQDTHNSIHSGAATVESEVKVRPKTPPPISLGIGTSSIFSSPVRSAQLLAGHHSLASSGVTSPSSLFLSPERGSRWPQIVSLPSPSPLPLLPSLDQVEGDHKYKPGKGLAQFCRDHTSTRDLLYCLLQGRPLVIIGEPSQENIIRRLVRVLWMFVPGHSSFHQVIPWRLHPLTSDDIARVKLIGLCQTRFSKTPAIPPHVNKYVSYWDCTPGVSKVCTPPYEGEVLKPILSRTKDRKNEATFLTHIHSVLSELVLQAYVFYHGYCLQHTHRNLRNMSVEAAAVRHHKVTSGKEETRKTRRQFLQQMGLKSHDADIVEYFVSVVQGQQLQEYSTISPTAIRGGREPVRLQLKTKTCQNSLCKPKKPY